MTAKEFFSLPQNDKDRWLIAGKLRERPLFVATRFRARTMVCVGTELLNWLDIQESPQGVVLSGDAGFWLQHDPDTVFGVDVAYVAADVMRRQREDIGVIDGIPTLAIEILSPSDTFEDIHEKLRAYLAAGVPLVWIIDPEFRTATVYRPDDHPQLFHEDQELTAEPHLPGFRVPMKRLFE